MIAVLIVRISMDGKILIYALKFGNVEEKFKHFKFSSLIEHLGTPWIWVHEQAASTRTLCTG